MSFPSSIYLNMGPDNDSLDSFLNSSTHENRIELARRLQRSTNEDLRKAAQLILESPFNPDWMWPEPQEFDPFTVVRETHEKFGALLKDRGIEAVPLISELQSMYHDEIMLGRYIRDGLEEGERPEFRRRLALLLGFWSTRKSVLERLQREYLTSFEIRPLSNSDVHEMGGPTTVEIPSDIFSGRVTLRHCANKLFNKYCENLKSVNTPADLKALYGPDENCPDSGSTYQQLQTLFRSHGLGAKIGYEPRNSESFMSLVEACLEKDNPPGL